MRPTATLSWTLGAGLAALVAFGASGQGQVASEEEAMQVAEKRSETMKSMGRSMRTLKGFVEGRGTAEEAAAAATVIADAAPTLPSLFPAGTGMAALPDSESKENIWEEWDEFVASHGTARGKGGGAPGRPLVGRFRADWGRVRRPRQERLRRLPQQVPRETRRLIGIPG